MIDLTRRHLLKTALFVAAAPVIVRASSLMHVRAVDLAQDYPVDECYFGLAQVRQEGGVARLDPWYPEQRRFAVLKERKERIAAQIFNDTLSRTA